MDEYISSAQIFNTDLRSILFPKCIGFGVKTRSYAKPDFLPFPVHITCSAFPSAFRGIENESWEEFTLQVQPIRFELG